MAGDYDQQSIWEAMEDDLIASYRRNMARHTAEEAEAGFSWTMWQKIKLQDLKRFEDDVSGLIGKYGSQSNKAIQKSMADSFKGGAENSDRLLKGLSIDVSDPDDFFKTNRRKIAALQGAIGKDLADAKQAVLRMSKDVFRSTIYKAQTFYNAGASTLWKAVDMASKDFLSRGLNCIEYSNGARVNIASYAEMALRASAKKAYMVGEGRRSAGYGVTLCQVTQYSACSPTCRPWQGRIYIDDVYAGGKSGDGDYPLLSQAIAGGLFHPNCRHIKQPWYPGISEELQPLDDSEMGENYDAEQRQREIERNIRKYKRRASGSLDPKNRQAAEDKVREWQGEMRRHLEENPQLRRSSAREQIRGNSSPKRSAADSFQRSVPFNGKATFKISIPDYSPEVSKRVSQANKTVVERGVKSGHEHLILVDVSNGKWEYEEEGDSGSVGGQSFFDFLYAHPDGHYAFVHNHPSGMMPSLMDINTYLQFANLDLMEAVGHNGTVYYLQGAKKQPPSGGAYMDALHHDNEILAALREKRKQGIIDDSDYPREADRLRAEYLISTYCGKLIKEDT